MELYEHTKNGTGSSETITWTAYVESGTDKQWAKMITQ